MIGKIQVVTKPCGNDPALNRVAEYLESCEARLPGAADELGYTISAQAPGPDAAAKPWLKTSECGQVWMTWGARCGKWVASTGAPGERQTRRRVASTVAEELAANFANWQLADGTNLLGVDLRQTKTLTSVYRLNFPPLPEVETIPTQVGDSLVWERMISAYPEIDEGTAIHFFVAKYDIKLETLSAEVRGNAVEIHLRVDGVLLTNLVVNNASGSIFYGAKPLDGTTIKKGKVVTIYIAKANGSSGTEAADLTVELRGMV